MTIFLVVPKQYQVRCQSINETFMYSTIMQSMLEILVISIDIFQYFYNIEVNQILFDILVKILHEKIEQTRILSHIVLTLTFYPDA